MDEDTLERFALELRFATPERAMEMLGGFFNQFDFCRGVIYDEKTLAKYYTYAARAGKYNHALQGEEKEEHASNNLEEFLDTETKAYHALRAKFNCHEEPSHNHFLQLLSERKAEIPFYLDREEAIAALDDAGIISKKNYSIEDVVQNFYTQ